MRSLFALAAALWLATAATPQAQAPATPEAKAVAFLLKEVPKWRAEKGCASCHHNGDAARALFYSDASPAPELLAAQLTSESRAALHGLADRFAAVEPWVEQGIQSAFEGALKAHSLKMPKLAMPLRAVVFGTTQTPALYPTLAAAGRARVVERIRRYAG